MGVREFNHVVERTVALNRGTSDPHTWAGSESDPFWDHSRHQPRA